MPVIDVRKQTGNPPAPADTTNAMGIGYDTNTKNIKVNDGTTAHICGGYRVVEALTAAKTLLPSDTGKTFTMNALAGFAITLPAVADAAGVQYSFHVKVATTSVGYTIVTASAEEKLGGLIFAGAGTDEDSELGFTGTTVTFVNATSVITDSCDMWCDGAGWYVRGYCNATGGITITG